MNTIALPGSQMSCTRLPVHPLEIRDNHPAHRLALPEPDEPLTSADDVVHHQALAVSRPTSNTRTANTKSSEVSVLDSARELRRKIVAEIECAKVELWETSIEGGTLAHLLKDSNL